ncbi:MAG: hypothetical protein ACE5EY_09540 [Anaerolineae bacterium]
MSPNSRIEPRAMGWGQRPLRCKFSQLHGEERPCGAATKNVMRQTSRRF